MPILLNIPRLFEILLHINMTDDNDQGQAYQGGEHIEEKSTPSRGHKETNGHLVSKLWVNLDLIV